MSQPARSIVSEADAFGEADLDAERPDARRSLTVYPPQHAPSQSDISELTVPPGQLPSQNLPGSIEEAVLAALDQIPRIASVPPSAPAPTSDDIGSDER